MSYKKLTIQEAGQIIRCGGIVAYPTETVYGLGVDPSNSKAVDRLFDLKKRDRGKPVLILLSSSQELSHWVQGVGERELCLMRHFWPGPLTMVFPVKKEVSQLVTGGGLTLGVRVSSDPVARQLAKAAGGAITSSSANEAGQIPCTNAKIIHQIWGEQIDGIVVGLRSRSKKTSTILDVCSKELKVLREGRVSLAQIREILKNNHFHGL